MIPRKLHKIERIPYYRQEKDYTCAPATIRMALAALGQPLTEAQILRCLKKLGVAHMMGYRLRYNDLMMYSKLGITIVDWAPQVLFPEHPEFLPSKHFNPEEESHCAIVVSASPQRIVLQDPVLGRRVRLSRKDFLKAWSSHQVEEDRWMIAILPRIVKR
jgi:ABC-type bacteriocin/lantibiotic exporter with double-glycine peptidase domain